MKTILGLFGLSGLQFTLGAVLLLAVASGSAWGAWEIRSGMAARDTLSATQSALAKAQKDAAYAAQQTAIEQQITYDYGMAFAQSQQQSETRTQTIVREVQIYVPQKADLAAPIPFGFVRVFDAAASGSADPSAIPIAAGQSDDAASGVKLSEIAAVSAGDFGACRENADQLTALQGWVAAVKAWGDKVQASLAK